METLVNMTLRVREPFYRAFRKYLIDIDQSFNRFANETLLARLMNEPRFVEYLKSEETKEQK